MPEAIASTLLAVALVYPVSPKMATTVLFIGIPVLLFLLPWRGEGAQASRRILRDEDRGSLLSVAGVLAIAVILLLIAYTRPSIALPSYITFIGTISITFTLLHRFNRIYSASTSQRTARVLAVLTTGLLLSAYYLGLGSLIQLIGLAFDLPEGGA